MDSSNQRPFVDDEDVPMELQSWTSPAKDEYDTDGNHFARWDYVLNEMISFAYFNLVQLTSNISA